MKPVEPRSTVPKWTVQELDENVSVSSLAQPSVSVTVTTPLPLMDCVPVPLQTPGQTVDVFSGPVNVIVTVSPESILCSVPPLAAITELVATGVGTGTVTLTAVALPTW